MKRGKLRTTTRRVRRKPNAKRTLANEQRGPKRK